MFKRSDIKKILEVHRAKRDGSENARMLLKIREAVLEEVLTLPDTESEVHVPVAKVRAALGEIRGYISVHCGYY